MGELAVKKWRLVARRIAVDCNRSHGDLNAEQRSIPKRIDRFLQAKNQHMRNHARRDAKPKKNEKLRMATRWAIDASAQLCQNSEGLIATESGN
jgi:hypothetical protein